VKPQKRINAYVFIVRVAG